MQPTTAKDELIAKLMKKKIRLSYSSLKNFTSPVNFINYKLKKYEPNASMIFGSLCDCLILEEHLFDKKFKIVDNVPTTDNQKGFANAIIEIGKQTELTEELIEATFKEHYSRGDAMKTYNSLLDYVNGSIKGVTLITQDVFDEAKELTENLSSRPEVEFILSQASDVQKKVEFDYNGWQFVGFLDLLLPDHIIDLKFTKDANPEKFERDVFNLDYFLQAAIYCYAIKKMGISESPKYSFLTYDKSGNFSIIEVDYSYLNYGTKKFKYLVQELDRCIDEGAFDESFNFFKRNYVIGRPKWAKGFELKETE